MPASRSINSPGSLRRRCIVIGWALVAVVVSGRTALRAAGPESTLVAPTLDTPALLTPTDVAAGLRQRLATMADGDAARQLRAVGEPRDYAPPDDADGPLPPDASGGEADVERVGGGE